MYTVMIVDDEKAIRENLPKIIPFEEYGFKVCQTARNGEEALEKLPQCRPDVVFLDVCMPGMDGLSFLRKLHQKGSESKPYVVMLSGYSDFEYARSAMRYGVRAYLTKPVDEDEVGSLLGELKAVLLERERNQQKTSMQQYVDAVKEMYHNGDGDRNRLRGFRMLHCVILQSDAANEEGYRIVRETIQARLPGAEAAFCRNRGSVVSYLMAPGALQEYQESVTLFGRHLLHHLKKEGVDCALLFDDMLFENPESTFRNDHDTHLYRMLTKVFWEEEKILLSSRLDGQAECEHRLEGEESYLEEMKRAILDKDREKLKTTFMCMDKDVCEKKLNIVFLQELGYRLYYSLTDLCKKEGIEVDLQPFDWRDMPCYFTYPDWSRMLWEQVFSCMENKGRALGQGMGEQVVAWVERHFMEPITLKSVADRFYLNPAYLGRSFQKLTGKSLKQYVNDLRIEEAKRLLRTTDKLIYEIAGQTGFAESKYFVSRFTQLVGCSPLEYRKMSERESNK